ncbi:protein mono-ADP-ribosyltransferase PARP16-like isoform X1 [Montipora capricornis]|uniref:protein mono-ADP-ribosyltransferase PARP16-like isoform X1 n=1 Tax=Montipora capricornis TaxID=246305 RepID=UPI0035F1A3C1
MHLLCLLLRFVVGFSSWNYSKGAFLDQKQRLLSFGHHIKCTYTYEVAVHTARGAHSTTSNGYQVHALILICNTIPSFDNLLKGKVQISQEAWEILEWSMDRTFSLKSIDKSKFSEIEQKTGEASYSATEPDFIFEVEYSETNAHNVKFNELSQTRDIWYADHGSRVDNFHSILHHGLHAHLNKPLWPGPSCVAVCEVLDHPDIKCTIKLKDSNERQSRSRARARNSEGGDLPERYYVVTNNQVVRVKYVLVYAKKKPHTRVQARNWLVCRYPLASMMVIYVVILVLIGFSKTRHFQNFYSKYIKES